MSPVKSVALIKLGFFALDQIAKWVAVVVKAQANPNMTEAEVDKLVADEQANAVRLSDAWRAYRQS